MACVKVSVGGTYHFSEADLREVFQTFRGMFLERFPAAEVRQAALILAYGENLRQAQQHGAREVSIIVQAPASILSGVMRKNTGDSMVRELSRAKILAQTSLRLLFVPGGEK